MPNQQHLSLKWAQKEEKRKKHAEAQRRHRDKEGNLKRSEMSSEYLAHVRELDRNNKKTKKENMTKEEHDAFKARDRERKAKERKAKKNREMKDKAEEKQDVHTSKKKKLRQKKHNDRIQRKIRDERTEEEKERRNAEQAGKMRKKRSKFSNEKKMLEKKKSKEAMRVCRSRKFGYLRQYKQRKIRDEIDPSQYGGWGVSRNGFSNRTLYLNRRRNQKYRLYRDTEEESKNKKKEDLKMKNRIRVQRHRERIKKLLEEPVIIDDYGEKGAYELLRESNIREFERLKKESGLFD